VFFVSLWLTEFAANLNTETRRTQRLHREERLNGFGLDRVVARLPTVPAADQRAGFGPSCLSEFLRHTGAGSFVWSSAVGNQPCLLRKFQFLGLYRYVLLRRHAHRAFRLQVACVAASFGAHVEEYDLISQFL